MFGRTKSTLGLDPGTRALKGICLKKANGKVTVDRFFYHDLSVANEAYPQGVELQTKLGGLVEASKLTNHEVSSVVENSDVAHLEFSLPEMPLAEMESAIANEVEENLNMSPNEISFDYLFDPVEEAGVKKMKVKVYWVRKDFVLSRMKLLHEAKLKPAALEPAIMAQLAMLNFNGYLKEDQNYLTVDLGESHTSVTLHKQNVVKFTHNYPMGSGYVNTVLMKTIGCTYSEAESRKERVSLDPTVPATDEATEVIRSAYGEVFKNVKESLEAAQAESVKVESVLLIGGGGYAKDIVKAMGQIVCVPITIVNPLQNIEIFIRKNAELGEELASRAGYLSTAIGLALRGLE